jgi:hypothetical protein
MDSDMGINNYVKKLLLFPLSKQFEFLTNYTSLKTDADGKDVLPVKQVLEGLSSIYLSECGVDSVEYKVCSAMLTKLGEGLSIFETMEEWFHPDICLTYQVSLAAGSQRKGVNAIIESMRQQNARKVNFIKAMVIPAILCVVGVSVACVISIGILPTFFYSAEEREHATGLVRFVIKLGEIISDFWPLLTFGPLPFIAGFVYLTPRKGLTTIYRNFTAGRFYSLLSLLINSSLTVKESLLIIQPHVSIYLQEHIENMLDGTQEGSTEFKQLDTGLLPLKLRVRMHVSGKSKAATANGVFAIIAEHAGKDFDEAIQKTQGVIKWTLLGVGLGLLGLSIASIFSMAANMINQ